MKPAQTDSKTYTSVLKFGGTCLHPPENRQQVITRIISEKKKGNRVVAVVSAMGRLGDPYATDTLESMLPARSLALSRERDALLCCGEGISSSIVAAELSAAGHPAVSLRGAQLGLFTDESFGNANILSIDPAMIEKQLDRGLVVVAAGFQGVRRDGSVTTLGRGGSDTTAVAVAAALGVKKVLFFKDVEGIFNADPDIVPAARPLSMIPYDEAAHMAYSGARVLHPRSADLAKQHSVTAEIRSLFEDKPGTVVCSSEAVRESDPGGDDIFAVACLDKISQLIVQPGPDQVFPAFPMRLFEMLASEGISLDMINVLEKEVLFTTASEEISRAADIAAQAGCKVAEIKKGCAKVSLLGGGIHGKPGIMSLILQALAEKGVRVFQSVDTYTVISVLVEENTMQSAARALHEAFGLGREKQG